jgi:hypothetical protein
MVKKSRRLWRLWEIWSHLDTIGGIPGWVRGAMSIIGGAAFSRWTWAVTSWSAPIVVLAGLFCAAVVLFFWNQWAQRKYQARILGGVIGESQAEATPDRPFPSVSELGAPYLRGWSIRIADIPDEGAIVENKTFEDCTIRGPAVIFPMGCSLSHCGLGTAGDSIEALLYELAPDRKWVVGLVGVKNCTFLRCSFRGVGFAGNSELLKGLKSIPGRA